MKLISNKYLNKSKKVKIKELKGRLEEHIKDDKCFIVMISENKEGFLESSYFSGFTIIEIEKMLNKIFYETIRNCKLDFDEDIKDE